VANKCRILLQLDVDPLPSVFDRIVALDAGADEVLAYGGITSGNVVPLVQGAIFTRGPKDLSSTAIMIGGSNVPAAEQVMQIVRETFLPQFGLRVSILFDPNGASTTAAATVLTLAKHIDIAGAQLLVMGPGPVGSRVARLLAKGGANVRLGGKTLLEAEEVCNRLASEKVEPVDTGSNLGAIDALAECQAVIDAGPVGTQILTRSAVLDSTSLRMLVDLNAVPPAGIEGMSTTDRGDERDGRICYGALAVGELKMKLHKAAIGRLFERSDLVLDVEEIAELKIG
jgi:hypothetical protein